jgi:hypothetical protein
MSVRNSPKYSACTWGDVHINIASATNVQMVLFIVGVLICSQTRVTLIAWITTLIDIRENISLSDPGRATPISA